MAPLSLAGLLLVPMVMMQNLMEGIGEGRTIKGQAPQQEPVEDDGEDDEDDQGGGQPSYEDYSPQPSVPRAVLDPQPSVARTVTGRRRSEPSAVRIVVTDP
ncbi:hypothetical protein R1sor_003058 [Riccia sorocarpa]|uniref:Uncharacterized protein n=1 Tax=Riccia sorocarpa TaxID=122646 RepID=A0ABD3H2N4_9MARC